MRIHLTKAVILDLKSPQIMRDGFRVWLGGESGAGKSSAAMLICSQIIEQGGQVIVLDADGEYERLWELAPGHVQRIGYGGEPIAENSAEWCLDIVREGKSLLIDLSHWTGIETRKLDTFALEFMRGLFDLRRRHPKLTYVLVEEASNFVPQAQLPGQAENINAFLGIVTRGRKFGLQFILASQQQSLVDVRAIKGCNMRVFLRVSDMRDWKHIKPYVPEKLGVGFGPESKRDITKFKAGECVLVSRWTSDIRVRLDVPKILPKDPLGEAMAEGDEHEPEYREPETTH